MAKSSVIGSLRVNLGMDTAEFRKGVKQADKAMAKVAQRIKTGLMVAGAAAASAATLIGAAVAKSIEKADRVGEVADMLGVGAEALQEFRHAAEMSGMAVQNFDVALRRFIRRGAEAARGTGAAKNAFRDLGISLTDGQGRMKKSEDLLLEVADAMSKVKDPADKLRLAFQMFDTDGAAMVTVLAGGSEGMRKFAQEARDLGIVMSEETVRGAGRFKDNLDLIRKVAEGLAARLTAHLLPTLEKITAAFLAFVRDQPRVEGFFTAISDAIKWIVRETMRGITTLQNLAAIISQIGSLGTAILAGDWQAVKDAWNGFGVVMDENRQRVENTEAAIKSLLETSAADRIKSAFAPFEKPAPTAPSGPPIVTEQMKRAIDELKREGQRLTEAMRTPLEQYQANVARLNELMQAGAISSTTYARAIAEAQDEFAEASMRASEFSQTIKSNLESAFDSLIEGTFNAREALAGLMKDLAKMAMNSVFKTLFSPSEAGGAGLGGIFAGVGKLFGFAQGGQFKVGGSGGIDSQLVAFRASPNETVTVTRPDQDHRGGYNDNRQYHIDARGAQRGVGEEIRAAIEAYDREVAPRRAVSAMRDHHRAGNSI